MDSRLENIFRTTFRHTEATDTWQGIRRDENRDEGGKKDEKEESRKETPVWEDLTTVSVQALKMFLENLLSGANDPAEKKDTRNTSPDASQKTDSADMMPSPSGRGSAAQAARAYRHTAYAGQDPRGNAPVTQDVKKEAALSPAEIRTIHTLIDDLGTLGSSGITQLEIRRSDSFLQSLVDAAAAARQSL